MSTIKTNKYQITSHIENGIVILDNIEVIQKHRGNGVGLLAMQRFMNKYKSRKIELHAYAQDELTSTNKLVDFYTKFGFSVVCGNETIGYEMNNF